MRRVASQVTAMSLMISAITIALFVAAPIASADTVNVTTTWNVPTSTAFSVSYPFSNTNITFSPSSATFTDEPAEDQTDAISSYNITNDGNVNIDVNADFTADFPTGIDEFRTCDASSGGAPSGTCWWWEDTNETSNKLTIVSSLIAGNTENRWAWSSGTNAAGGWSERTYELVSTQS